MTGNRHPAQYAVKNHTLYIKPSGDLDHHNVEQIRTRADNLMVECEINSLVFDFEAVDFMDSAGIGLIMGRYRKIMGSGGKMKAVSVKPVVMRILKYSGLYQIMDINGADGGMSI